MKQHVLQPLGVEVTDVDLAQLGDDEVDEIVHLLAEHGVAVFADQDIDDDQFTAFLQRFGDLVFTQGETPVKGHRDLNVISNVGRVTPPRSTFHTDSSYFVAPPTYTALRAVSIPSEGGETLFTDQYAALADLDRLEPGLRQELDGRCVLHVVTGVSVFPGDECAALHPAVLQHPVSGREALYLSSPQRCVALEGMGDEDARAVLDRLFAYSTREENVVRHRWRPRDVVMWDNRCVLHRADHSAVAGDRVMHRGMVVERVRGSVAEAV